MKDIGILHWVSWILVLAGGINWGLFGLFKLDLIGAILGTGFIGRIVFILIGLAAGYLIYMHFTKKNPLV